MIETRAQSETERQKEIRAAEELLGADKARAPSHDAQAGSLEEVTTRRVVHGSSE